MMGCASAPANGIETTPAARLAWLRAEVARAEIANQGMRGAYLPRSVPGAAIVCSLAIDIEPWYGVSDERWELSRANTTAMLPSRPSANIREELARIGIRDCVLDIDR